MTFPVGMAAHTEFDKAFEGWGCRCHLPDQTRRKLTSIKVGNCVNHCVETGWGAHSEL